MELANILQDLKSVSKAGMEKTASTKTAVPSLDKAKQERRSPPLPQPRTLPQSPVS